MAMEIFCHSKEISTGSDLEDLHDVVENTYTVDPHLSGHIHSHADCPDNWISG